ncbi:MAG: PepSY domain-containing protein [Nitrososphaera sp.]
MTKYINRKTALLAVVGAGAVSAVLLAVALVPNPASAFGPGRWMHGGGYVGYGPGHFGQGGMYEGNWTGSVPVESIRNDVIQSIKSKVNITVSEAESAAKQSLGDGSEICCVMLAPLNGYLVYAVHGIDGSNEVVKVIVDAGNGEVLESGKVGEMGGFGSWKGHRYGGEMWR